MSRRLAHRPRFNHARINPHPFNRSHQEYLRHRWMYRQQYSAMTQHPIGYGLSLLPWGWQRQPEAIQREA